MRNYALPLTFCGATTTHACELQMTPRPPKLTDEQKWRLRRLEPVLRSAARRGDYETARRITAEIQDVLRPTGHETRLMKAKNWLFEAALEAGKLQIAIPGFVGVRQKTNPRTRVHLEATALLAVCYLRSGDLDKAEPLIAEALRRDVNIRSPRRRAQFRRRMIDRFELEWVIAVLSAQTEQAPHLDLERVQDEAGELVRSVSDDAIMERLGREIAPDVVERIFRVYDFSRRQLAPVEQKYLPSPTDRRKTKEVGRTLLDSAKRVVWRSLCDPESEVYRMWFDSGMMVVLDKKLLTSAIVAALTGMRIGFYALAVSTTAIIMKMGLEVFCDRFRPEGLMIARNE